MPFHSAGTTWFLIVLFLITLTQKVSTARCRSALNVTDDGPAVLDVPVTVTARLLDCPHLATELVYLFEDDLQRIVRVGGRETASADFVFSDRVGPRAVQVTALLKDQFEVASGSTTFQVQEYLPGSLSFSGGVVEDGGGRKFAATGASADISAVLPPRLLREAEFAFSWSVGEEERFTSERPSVRHRFLRSGRQRVRVSAVGRLPDRDGSSFRYKWAYFDEDVTVKDPLTNINISGNTYLEHGQLLDLDISCNGSGPVQYCWKVLPQTENQTNLSCAEPVISTECSFPILYYFRDSGDYRLAIYVNNIVTSMQRNIEVHIYDVSLRPQLSTIIIPVICTILVVLIIASALVVHMRRRTHIIETADFDFMRPDDEESSSRTAAVETSWEVMRRSLLHLVQIHCLCAEGSPPAVSYGTIDVGKK